MKPVSVTCFECPECGNLHEEEYEAESCCPRDINETEGWKCSECNALFDDKDDAKECCK